MAKREQPLKGGTVAEVSFLRLAELNRIAETLDKILKLQGEIREREGCILASKDLIKTMNREIRHRREQINELLDIQERN